MNSYNIGVIPGDGIGPEVIKEAMRVLEAISEKAGFKLARIQSLQPHYARTLDTWAAALEAHKDEAIAVQSEEVYERYMRYLTGCAKGFHDGYINVCQYTLEK